MVEIDRRARIPWIREDKATRLMQSTKLGDGRSLSRVTHSSNNYSEGRASARPIIDSIGVLLRMITTSAIPPSTAMEASTNRSVIGSPKRTIPPAAVRTGTLSCTLAAAAAFKPGSAVYQIT
jgi:hypothetical protein